MSDDDIACVRVRVCVAPFNTGAAGKVRFSSKRRHPGPTTENSILYPSAMLVIDDDAGESEKSALRYFGFNNNETTTNCDITSDPDKDTT